MRSLKVLHILFLVYPVLAISVRAQLPQIGRDTIFLRQGDRLVGKLIGIDGQSIRLRRLLPPPAGASPDAPPVFASVAILRSHVDRVEFSTNEAQQRMLKAATAASASEIEGLWREARPWLSVPKSSAGEIGLAYGDLLLRNGDPANARKALELFKTIEAETWCLPDAMRARQGRLRAMVAAGVEQEAVAEAKELERTSQDPAVLIEAKFILAKVAEKALRKFVDENPRWEEDVFVRPERDRLYDQALELYLYPALFFGSEAEVAARGLWSVVEVSRFAGDLRQAVEASRDLVEIYPGTAYATQAQEFIDSLPESSKKQHDETQAKP